MFSSYMRRLLVIYDFAPDPYKFPNIRGKCYFLFYQCTLTLYIYYSTSLFPAVIPSEALTRNTSPVTGGARVVCPVVDDCVVVVRVVVMVEVVAGMVEVGAGAEGGVLGRHTPPVQDRPAQHWVILAKIKVIKKMFVVFCSHYVTVLNNVDTHSTK
jgi:hypothetical protein